MGFEIEWTDEFLEQFRLLLAEPGPATLSALKAVAGRSHEQWRYGRSFDSPDFVGDDIRVLEIGAAGLVYALHESEERVILLALLRSRPE